MPTEKECEDIVDDVLSLITRKCNNLPNIPFVNTSKLCKQEIDNIREDVKKAICRKYVKK